MVIVPHNASKNRVLFKGLSISRSFYHCLKKSMSRQKKATRILSLLIRNLFPSTFVLMVPLPNSCNALMEWSQRKMGRIVDLPSRQCAELYRCFGLFVCWNKIQKDRPNKCVCLWWQRCSKTKPSNETLRG